MGNVREVAPGVVGNISKIYQLWEMWAGWVGMRCSLSLPAWLWGITAGRFRRCFLAMCRVKLEVHGMAVPKGRMDFRQSGKLPRNPLRVVKYEDFLCKCPNEGLETVFRGVLLCVCYFLMIFPSCYSYGYCYIQFLSEDLDELNWCKN